MKKLILAMLCLCFTFVFFGCTPDDNQTAEKGDKGDPGKSAYDIAVENGFSGSAREWIDSLVGATGVGIAGISIDHDGYVYITLTNGEEYTVKVEDYCYHDSVTQIVTSPTCAERGYTTQTCNDCGFVITNSYVEKTGHHFVDKTCNTCGTPEPFGYITVDTDWYSNTNSDFIITSREQLAGLSYLVSEGNNFSGKTIKLGCDIDLGGAEWIPIGNEVNKFAGTFDGREYTIYNLKISEQTDYAGLFGNVSGTVKRTNVYAASVSVSGAGSYVAIACGYCSGTIDGVNTAGYVTAPTSSYVGGVCGKMQYPRSKNLTKNTNSATVVGGDYTGGVYGNLCGCCDVDANYTYTFSGCENSGDISGASRVGGIVGYICINNTNYYNDDSIAVTDMKNTGNVTANTYAGGIFGYASSDAVSTISSVSSSGTITAGSYVGGIAGYLGLMSILGADNTGTTVVATGYSTIDGLYYAYLGGYVGCGYYVENCTNASDISYTSKGGYVGGVAGNLTRYMRGCHNTGDVIAPGAYNVGGVAGKAMIIAQMTTDACTNSGNVQGLEQVGGVAGHLCGCCSIDGDYTSYLSAFSNSGDVTGTQNCGGIAGKLCIDNTDYNNNNSLVAVDFENSGNVTGTAYVGGIFGYSSADRYSTLTNATSSAAITGDYYVGGIAGCAINIEVIDSSNAASTIVANGYMTSNGLYYAYLGGYVGYGYGVRGCINAVNINYMSKGSYVGGIAGYLSTTAEACENNADVLAADSNYVAGIVGHVTYSGHRKLSNNVNTGDIVGSDYVGGICGYYYYYADIDSTFSCYISACENSGAISGYDNVGGICGSVSYNNVNYSDNMNISVTDVVNSGSISGNSYVGGLFGHAYVDGSGTLVDCTNTGTVVGNDNADQIIGNNPTNITI